MKLVSLNVEGDIHWERIKPFLFREQPDVICLQEVFEIDANRLGQEFGMSVVFEPMWQKVPRSIGREAGELMGLAIVSRASIRKTWSLVYHAPKPDIVPYENHSLEAIRESTRSFVLLAEVEDKEEKFVFATTHFTWTPDGLPNTYQRADAKELLKQLESVPDSILCGDFNMPRGVNEIYRLFTERYRDVIPLSYVSSIDMEFHRVKNDAVLAARLGTFMVDYIFLTKEYEANDVRLVGGVSDHYAVVAQISFRA